MQMRLRQLGVWEIADGTLSKPSGSPNSTAVKAWGKKANLVLGEIVGAVENSQLVHIRGSMEPSTVWRSLEEAHMSQGLGSIISTWQAFTQIRKAEEDPMEKHVSEIRRLADRLEGLGDGPSEILMVSILMMSLPLSYSPLIVSLDSHPQCEDFAFVAQGCLNKELRQKNHTTGTNTSKPGPTESVAYAAQVKPHRDKKDITCFNCQKKGHYRNECTEPVAAPAAKVEPVKDNANTAEFAWMAEVSDDLDFLDESY